MKNFNPRFLKFSSFLMISQITLLFNLAQAGLSSDISNPSEFSNQFDQNPISQNPTQNRIFLQEFNHIIMIVLENASYDEAMSNPYLRSLAQQGALFSNFTAVSHPSYPNYLAMVGGSTFNRTSDSQTTLHAASIADLLEARGLTWKGYAEDYPGNCFLGDRSGRYARKHVPFLSFASIQSNPSRCAQVVGADQFQTDWKNRQLPNFAFFTPNLDDDGHDTDLATASKWLENFLTPLLSDGPGMQSTLIEITFDESDSHFDNNQILTLFMGPMVQPGANISTHYNHYDVLRTIEDDFSLGSFQKNDRSAQDIEGPWEMTFFKQEH